MRSASTGFFFFDYAWVSKCNTRQSLSSKHAQYHQSLLPHLLSPTWKAAIPHKDALHLFAGLLCMFCSFLENYVQSAGML